MQYKLMQRVKLNECILCNSLYIYSKNKEIQKELQIAPLSCRDCMVDNKLCHVPYACSQACLIGKSTFASSVKQT